jgi:hypothetical protein
VGVTLVPEGGIVEGDGGENHVVYGIVVNRFDPSDRFFRDRRTGDGPFSGRDQLERASNDLIQSLLQANDYLGLLRRSAQEEMVDGERALSIVLSGRSPVTGELESVTVVTRGLPDGKLIYLLFIAPERRYAEVEQIMGSIVSSLSINDLALPR